MTWYPIAFLPPQYQLAAGAAYSGAVLKAYAEGTTTVIPMATDYLGSLTAESFALNASGYPVSDGGAVIIPHVQENYKLALYPDQAAADANSGAVWTYDNIQIADTTGEAFAQYFNGDGTTTEFTLSSNLGTDEKLLLVFADMLDEYSTNGTFDTDTDWTKGAGWTIASGVADAAGAISTSLTQDTAIPIIEGESYTLTFTVTRDAGGIIPNVGGTAGTERTAAGTYTETFIAGSTQVLDFEGNAFTGTIDNVKLHRVNSAIRKVLNFDEFTVNGTTLTIDPAPGLGIANVIVFAPAFLLGQAAASAAAAATSATDAINAVKTFIKYEFDDDTNMTDPGTGLLKLNSADLSMVSAIAIADETAQVNNPDISDWIITWDDASATIRGTLRITKATNVGVFGIYNITALTDNTGWCELAVTPVTSNGSLTDADEIFIEYYRSGNNGSGLAGLVDDTTPQLGGMLDVNGYTIGDGTNELLGFVEDASAVNYIQLENEATGSGPIIRSVGDDTDIDLLITPKGDGQLILDGLSWPIADGTSGQGLLTDGAGNLSFGSAGLTSVSQGDLNTSTGTISLSVSGNNGSSDIHATGSKVLLPGGEYGFHPTVKSSSSSSGRNIAVSHWNDSASYLAYMVMAFSQSSAASTQNLSCDLRQRYITSSPPFDMGDGDAQGFIFLLIENDKVISHYAADVPPWGYNGPTNIRCDFQCPKTRKKYNKVAEALTLEQKLNGEIPVYRLQEITQEVKNRDMGLIPHPFGELKPGQTVVMIDAMCEKMGKAIEYQNLGDGEIVEAIVSGKLKIDNEALSRKGPQGVMQVKLLGV